MESRQKDRVYEEFDPTVEWERDSAVDTLKVYLPGFRKEQLKVQVTTARFLRISGERELGDNKVIKFRKEIPIPPSCDTNQISAKFERGILYIKHPKSTTSDQKPAVEPPKQAPQPPKEAPKPPKPPQPKPQSPPKEKPEQPPPKIVSPKPKLPETEPDKAKTPAQRKDEVPSKAEEIKDAGTADVGAEKKQEKLAGADDVGRVAAGVEKCDYGRVMRDAVKNPKQVMEWIIRTLLVVFFWLRDMIMKPVKYFKKSEN